LTDKEVGEMRSAVYTILTSVLLLAPISAVPLMAIFGVPQFTPVVASPLDESEEVADDWDRPSRKPPRSKPSEDQLAAEELDRFEDESLDWTEPTKDRLQPIKIPRARSRKELSADELSSVPSRDRRPATRSKPSAPAGKPRRPSPVPDDTDELVEFASSESSDDAPSEVGNADFEREVDESAKAEPAKPPKSIPSYRRTRSGGESVRPVDRNAGRLKNSPPSGEPLTWSKAVVRLNELGIRNFKLEPGMRPGEFTFTCSYTPTNTPHVTRRFEAEADDPLKAVAQVLSQVERWARDAASKRAAEQPREVN
jgi:hypothetical protein